MGGVLAPDLNVVEKVKPRVTNAMNDELNKPYTREEVKKSFI